MEDTMQRIHLLVRWLNPHSRDAEPLTEIIFSDSKPGNPAPQSRRCVAGVEPLKRFFEEELRQSPANSDSLLRRLREEHCIEMRDVILFDGTLMKIRLE